MIGPRVLWTSNETRSYDWNGLFFTPLFKACPMCKIFCRASCGRSLRHVLIHGMARASLLCRPDLFFLYGPIMSWKSQRADVRDMKPKSPDLIGGRLLVSKQKKMGSVMMRFDPLCLNFRWNSCTLMQWWPAEASFRRSVQTQGNVFRLHHQERFRIKPLSPAVRGDARSPWLKRMPIALWGVQSTICHLYDWG